MKIKDIFQEIFVGVNLNNYSKTDETEEVYMFKKDNIVFNSILYNNYGYTKLKKEPYKYLPNKDLIKVKVSKNIKDKYYLKFGDVVISVKKPYKTFNDVIVKKNKIMVNNNYIILRKIDSDRFYAPYISIYLEMVGIEKYLKTNLSRINDELSIEDIKNIEIPNISKKKQIDIYFKIKSYITRIIECHEDIQKTLREDDIGDIILEYFNDSKNKSNPLVIYGNEETTKRSLNNIKNFIKEKSNKSILYITNNDLDEVNNNIFIEKYKCIDIVIFENITNLENNQKAQYNFFNLFNQLYNNKKLIIIFSNKNPNNLNIEPRLITRLNWGLLLKI